MRNNSASDPVVITTKRVVWHSNQSKHHLHLTELASVRAPEAFQTRKLDMSKLVVTTRSGEKHELVTARGETLFILWNLLLNFTPRHPE